MKRPLIAVAMMLAGAGILGSMRLATSRLDVQAAAARDAVQAQSMVLDRKRHDAEEARVRLDELRQLARSQPRPDRYVGAVRAALSVVTAGAEPLAPAQSERLLAELGFNWNTTGPYVVVSKSTLRNVSLEGMAGASPTDAACGVLAITQQERAAIAASAQAAVDQFKSWAAQHVTRTGAEGRALFKYEIPPNPEFSSDLKDAFTAAVIGALGEERGGLFLDYASDWMRDFGMFGIGSASLTVERPAGSNPLPLYTLRTGHFTLTSAITPRQPFPQSFLPLFPGGWRDLARRERFDLPPEFDAPK